MAKKHSVLKFIAASALAAVFAGMTASFFRKRREKRMDDGFDDFDSFDTYEEAGKKDEIKKEDSEKEASEDDAASLPAVPEPQSLPPT